MKKKTIWLLVSSLIVAALLLVSCGPTVTEEEEAALPPVEEVAPPEEKEATPPEGEEEVLVPLEVTLRIEYGLSGSWRTHKQTFTRADITDEEIREIAWDWIVADARKEGVDPNSIVYDVKILDTPPKRVPVLGPGLEYTDPSTIFEERPPYPDGRVYSKTSNIKVYKVLGPKTSGYLRDGLAYLRNEGESGFIRVTIIPIGNYSRKLSLPEKEECLDNVVTIFVEANKSVRIDIARYLFKEGQQSSHPHPCWNKAIFTGYESYVETETEEFGEVQGRLLVRLCGSHYSSFAKGVGVYTYPRFLKSKYTVNNIPREDIYRLNERYTYVKVW